QLPYTAYFDSIGGLSISTDASVSAQYLFSNDNRSYIEGRAAYMRNAQPALTENDSIILEYLFRHEATVHGLDQDFLMALCRTESTYDLSLLERKSPIGLMQLMPRTVTGSGWTIEEVRDKHGNIQFGASYIAALIEMYNGNETKALAAYNQGSGKVASGNYSTGYSAKVQSYRTSLINWCSSHGYSNTFHEVSERLTGK
ncbi:MAG: transglycosylase SLT domain-containing protein, partial [Firmicutes bacterium]|nr:transglycosylase SLT domain-containing protein [Bacillota bacterium]